MKMDRDEMAPQVVLITGAGSGIGLATATRLAQRGASLALTHFGEDEAIASLVGEHARGQEAILASRVDARDRNAVSGFVASAEERFGQIDAVVTCAGVHVWGPSDEISWSDWDQVIEVNLTGTFAFIRAAMPGMKARGHGRIVTFSSELALTGHEEYAAYCASKGAIVALTKALGRELAPHGVLVNSIAPGPVETPMMRESPEYDDPALLAGMPIGRLGRPEEIAAVVEMLIGDAGSFFVGQTLSPNGGAVI